jgi:hypothetical protein
LTSGGKGTELLDNQQRASRDDGKRNIFFLMLNAGHPVYRSPIPFNQIVVDECACTTIIDTSP